MLSTDTTLSRPGIAVKLPDDEPPKGLAELQESLAHLEVPTFFRSDLQNYLSPEEKAKLALFCAIRIGLEECGTVFSPKRYPRFDCLEEKLRAETTLWLRTLWREGLSATEAESAFQAHLGQGRRFPTPADILELVKDTER